MIKFLVSVAVVMVVTIVVLFFCWIIDELIDRNVEKGYLPHEYYNYFYKGDYVVLWTVYKKSDIREREVRRKGNKIIEEIVMKDRKRGKRIAWKPIEVNESWEKEYNRWNKRWGKVIKGKEDK